jgi:hypothetical protein
MQVFHTAAVPPINGNTILANIGWTENNSAALRNTAHEYVQTAVMAGGTYDGSFPHNDYALNPEAEAKAGLLAYRDGTGWERLSAVEEQSICGGFQLPSAAAGIRRGEIPAPREQPRRG